MLHESALCHLIFITTLNVPNVYKCKWVFFQTMFPNWKIFNFEFYLFIISLYLYIYTFCLKWTMRWTMTFLWAVKIVFPKLDNCSIARNPAISAWKKKQRPFTNFTTICNRNIGDVTKSTTSSVGLILIQDKHFSISFQDVTT